MHNNLENLKKISFSILRKFESNCWIAGGAITSTILDEKIDNINIFFPDEECRQNGAKKMFQMRAEKINGHPLEEKFRLDGKIYDLIHAGRSPEETILKSDWSVCCAAIDKRGNFYYHEKFFDHIGTKKLHFIGNYSNSRQLSFKSKTKRLIKYVEKGYKIEKESLL